MNELTNDAKFLITFMYAKYLEKIKEGTPKEEARNFQSIDYIQEHIMPEWSRDDVLDTCRELSRHSYVNGTFGNNDFYTHGLISYRTPPFRSSGSFFTFH